MHLTKYGPKSRASPTLGDPCSLCGEKLAAGDYTTLVRSTANGRYANDAIEVHWDCVATRWPRGTDGSHGR